MSSNYNSNENLSTKKYSAFQVSEGRVFAVHQSSLQKLHTDNISAIVEGDHIFTNKIYIVHDSIIIKWDAFCYVT